MSGTRIRTLARRAGWLTGRVCAGDGKKGRESLEHGCAIQQEG
jgi:hypothetical protein